MDKAGNCPAEHLHKANQQERTYIKKQNIPADSEFRFSLRRLVQQCCRACHHIKVDTFPTPQVKALIMGNTYYRRISPINEVANSATTPYYVC